MNIQRCFSLARRLLVVTIVCILALSPILPAMTKTAEAQGGSINSTIELQMPFIAGEEWLVGGPGYWYGEGDHCNDCYNPRGYNDYYATDWNRPLNDDLGRAVLPVANGTVTAARIPPCPPGGYGCYVQVDHANGYQTTYAHLNAVNVVTGTVVRTSTLLGLVGSTGSSSGPHLHLSFRRDGTSYCWNDGNLCPPNNELPHWPQGHRPSPMLTAAGNVTLVDYGSYTSVNGRLYLADLQTPSGWTSTIYVRNNGTQARSITAKFYTTGGSFYSSSTCPNLAPQNTCSITSPFNFQGSAYIDGAENISGVAYIESSTRSYALEAVPSGGLHGGPGTGSVGYIPSYLVNYYGWNSSLRVQNASSTSTTVNAYFYSEAGINPVGSVSNISLPAYGQVTLSLSGASNGSVRVVSNNSAVPLAVMVKHENSSVPPVDTIAYAGGVEGGTLNYAASLLKNYWNWNSAYISQEISGNSGHISVGYYPSGSKGFDLNSFGSREVYMGAEVNPPDGVAAGVIAVSSGNARIFSAIHHANGAYGLGYPAVTKGGNLLYLPWVRKNPGGWVASVTVYNVGGATTSVTLDYRNPDGSSAGNPTTFSLASGANYEVYTELPNGGYSVVVSAPSWPVVVVAHGSDLGSVRGTGYTAIP